MKRLILFFIAFFVACSPPQSPTQGGKVPLKDKLERKQVESDSIITVNIKYYTDNNAQFRETNKKFIIYENGDIKIDNILLKCVTPRREDYGEDRSIIEYRVFYNPENILPFFDEIRRMYQVEYGIRSGEILYIKIEGRTFYQDRIQALSHGAQSAPKYHKANKGETITLICKRYKISFDDLRELNTSSDELFAKEPYIKEGREYRIQWKELG